MYACLRWLNVVIALDLSCEKYVGKLAQKTVFGGSRLWFVGICIAWINARLCIVGLCAVSSCILRYRVAIVVCYQNYMLYCMAFLVVVTRCIILPWYMWCAIDACYQLCVILQWLDVCGVLSTLFSRYVLYHCVLMNVVCYPDVLPVMYYIAVIWCMWCAIYTCLQLCAMLQCFVIDGVLSTLVSSYVLYYNALT